MARSLQPEIPDDLARALEAVERDVAQEAQRREAREKDVAQWLAPVEARLAAERARALDELEVLEKEASTLQARLAPIEERLSARRTELELIRAQLERWRADPDREWRDRRRLQLRAAVDRAGYLAATSVFLTGVLIAADEASSVAGWVAVMTAGLGVSGWLSWLWFTRDRVLP